MPYKIIRSLFADFSGQKNNQDDWRDLDFIVRLTSTVMLISLELSWHLYIRNGRIFLPAPVILAFTKLPTFIDFPIFFIATGCLLWLVKKPQDHFAAYLFLAIMVFWILQDLLRLQPYLCMYCFTLLVGAVSRHLRHCGLSALRVMVASVYFWGGFHKCNFSFISEIFPWFVSPFYTMLGKPSWENQIFLIIEICVPLFEILIGLFLFFPKYRSLATKMALAMLLVVLVCLGPFGHNWNMIVWPWNIYLFVIEVILFLKIRPAETDQKTRYSFLIFLSIAIFTVAPAFALAGFWSAYPAFKLYSGNTPAAEITFAPEELLSRLPLGLEKNMVGGKLHLQDWTAHEFNTVVYPEPYVFIKGAKGICPYLSNPGAAMLTIYSAPPFYSLKKNKTDLLLCTDNQG